MCNLVLLEVATDRNPKLPLGPKRFLQESGPSGTSPEPSQLLRHGGDRALAAAFGTKWNQARNQANCYGTVGPQRCAQHSEPSGTKWNQTWNQTQLLWHGGIQAPSTAFGTKLNQARNQANGYGTA